MEIEGELFGKKGVGEAEGGRKGNVCMEVYYIHEVYTCMMGAVIRTYK